MPESALELAQSTPGSVEPAPDTEGSTPGSEQPAEPSPGTAEPAPDCEQPTADCEDVDHGQIHSALVRLGRALIGERGAADALVLVNRYERELGLQLERQLKLLDTRRQATQRRGNRPVAVIDMDATSAED